MMRNRLVIGVLALATLVGFVPAPAQAGLAIRQRSNGIPGKGEGREVEQRLLIGERKFRIDEPDNPKARHVIVRLDKGVIWELDPKLEEWTETKFEYWRMQREEAEQERERKRKAALERLSGEEQEKWFRAHPLIRRDGKRILEVIRGPWEPSDGARVQRIAIQLNGVTQVAVWQTDRYKDEYQPPRELFDFYDKTGFLPDDISSQLKAAVTHFPVRVVADIDFSSAGATIDTRILGVQDWEENPRLFEVPSGYDLVKEFTKEQIAKKEHRCPICKKAFDPRMSAFPSQKGPGGERVFFDTEECWLEYQQKPRK